MTYVHPFADARVIQGRYDCWKLLNPELTLSLWPLVEVANRRSCCSSKKHKTKHSSDWDPSGSNAFQQPAAVSELNKIDTQAGTLAPKTETLNFELIQKHVDHFIRR